MDCSDQVPELSDGLLPIKNRRKCIKMPVNGQGTFTFNIKMNEAFVIAVRDEKERSPVEGRLWLEVHANRVKFMKRENGEPLKEITTADCGLVSNTKVSYWLSYDRDRMILKYGKGYHMEETTLLQYAFIDSDNTEEEKKQLRKKYYKFFNAEQVKVVELYEYCEDPRKHDDEHREDHSKHGCTSSGTSLQDVESSVSIDRNPFVVNPPPVVLDCSKVSLFALDSTKYTLAGSLPSACRELFDNIRNCELNWPKDVADVLLSDAIRYSINTPGCLLYEKINEKSNEFGKADIKKTYLRVTLGHSFGNSPGIPYVLEIWPARHYSPVHNHGGASAVIKVLHGSIHVTCYNKREKTDPGKKLLEFEAKKGDVTWIDKNWYQTHKLVNKSTDFCATIQCYNYAQDDPIHWPYFDYVKEGTYRNQFLPNSDFTFRDMREKVMQELRDSHKKEEEKAETKKNVVKVLF